MQAISSVVVAVAGLVQAGASLVAVYFISKTLDEHKDELEAMPTDEAVAKLDRKSKEVAAQRRKAIDWRTGVLPRWIKRLLVLAQLCISVSCYAFYL